MRNHIRITPFPLISISPCSSTRKVSEVTHAAEGNSTINVAPLPNADLPTVSAEYVVHEQTTHLPQTARLCRHSACEYSRIQVYSKRMKIAYIKSSKTRYRESFKEIKYAKIILAQYSSAKIDPKGIVNSHIHNLFFRSLCEAQNYCVKRAISSRLNMHQKVQEQR